MIETPDYSSADLPSGTLTFLLTDLERSTQLWETYPHDMRTAMARHDELIESCVAQAGGVVVRPRGEGDSRFAVFQRATDALTAAIAIQRSFSWESWAVPYPLRVRLALHTGEAELRSGDYYGSAVNRCARLRSVAHGGQTVLSQTTRCLVAESLPERVGLRDLGEHKLKDLTRPERIYQLVVEGLEADFPPLKTPDSSLAKLPHSITSFIGRANEMAEVIDGLKKGRLLTIFGSGGSGKTRLALQTAADLVGLFPDGVWFVDLAPLSNPALVPQYVMNYLGVREEICCPPLQTLLDSLRDKTLLLILDNCEHILEGVSQLVDSLMSRTLKLKILATSREPLDLPGEMVWSIPPLSTPKLDGDTSPGNMLRYESVKLFVERAMAARSDFFLSDNNAKSVAQICARLDGIPLAIELAAARVRVLTVKEIAGRLDDRFRLLIGPQNAVPRHKTLGKLIDWSHDLLPENERILFRRLSVFSDGWILQAAEEICSGGSFEPAEVLDLLAHLIDKSLVIIERHADGKRYRFLETIRQYARKRLAESDEADEFSRRFTTYFAKMAEDSYAEQWGPRQGYWFARLEAEHDNLRAAMDWLAQTKDSQELLLDMSGSLWRFWEVRGHISEGRARLEYALEHASKATTHARANGLRGAGMLARQQGDFEQATILHRESLSLFRQIDDQLGIGRELDVLGEIEKFKGNYPEAIRLHSESLSLRKEIGDTEGIAVSLGQLGIIARDRGDYQEGRELLEQSIKLCRQLGDKLLIAKTLNNLGLVEFSLCEYERATRLFEEAVSLYRELNDKVGISNTLQNLGNVAKDQGDFKGAQAIYGECLAFEQELGDRHGIAQTMVRMSELAFYQGNYPKATDLAQKSGLIFQELGVKRGFNYSLQMEALVAVFQGDFDRAQTLGQEFLTLSAEVNSPRAIAYSKLILGMSAYGQANLDQSRELLLGARDIFLKFGDRRSVALTCINLARSAYRQGDCDQALRYLEEALAISRELEIHWVTNFGLEIMGLIRRSEGQYESAFALFQESLTGSIEQENQQGITNCLGALAGMAILVNRPVAAARMFAAAEKIRQEIGVEMAADDRREYDRYVTLLREQLDAGTFATAWSEGRTMSLGQVAEGMNEWPGIPAAVPMPALI